MTCCPNTFGFRYRYWLFWMDSISFLLRMLIILIFCDFTWMFQRPSCWNPRCSSSSSLLLMKEIFVCCSGIVYIQFMREHFMIYLILNLPLFFLWPISLPTILEIVDLNRRKAIVFWACPIKKVKDLDFTWNLRIHSSAEGSQSY